MQATIATLPGDGIGPEVTRETVRLLAHVARRFEHRFDFPEYLVGGGALDAVGTALPPQALAACLSAQAVLFGAVGGPRWNDPRATTRPEDSLLILRQRLGLFANLRPIRPHPKLAQASVVREENLRGVDFVIVRELTGGLYYGQPKQRRSQDGQMSAVDTLEYHDYEVRRIVELAFKLAGQRKRHVTSVDKANALATSRLWREVAGACAAEFPGLTLDHMLVDTAAMKLIATPAHFDVLVTENTFGDILSDEAAVLVGSLGLLPSASLGAGTVGLYEPIHGSAPDIAGQGIANPLGSILSGALLLRHSLDLNEEALAVERAVDAALHAGCRTADIARPGERVLSTTEMTDEVIARL